MLKLKLSSDLDKLEIKTKFIIKLNCPEGHKNSIICVNKNKVKIINKYFKNKPYYKKYTCRECNKIYEYEINN